MKNREKVCLRFPKISWKLFPIQTLVYNRGFDASGLETTAEFMLQECLLLEIRKLGLKSHIRKELLAT